MHEIIDKKFYLGPKFGTLFNKKWVTISELLQGNLWHESQVTFSTCERWDCRVLWHYLQLWRGFEYIPQMRGKSSKNVSHTGVDNFFLSLLWVRRTKTILFYFIKKNCWDGGYMLPDSIWATHLKTNQSFKHTRY
jgi:hypothetical protein